MQGQRKLRVGDILSVCRPTPVLKKISYQWTEPEYVVVQLATSTVTVRKLSNKGEAKLSKIRKNKGLSSIVVNMKMTRAYPVPAQFFVGATVAKKFSGKWFLGKVDKVHTDERETL